MLVSLFLGRVALTASLGLALWSAGTTRVSAEQQTALTSFLPTQPGTLWVYLSSDGLKRIESLRSLEADGKLLFDVEELRGTECLRRFSYESGLEGDRWVRRGPDGDEVILSPPLQPGTRWRWGQSEQVELEVLSSSERVQVPGGTFSSCLKLRKRAGDRDTYLYLAPGVGVVRETTLEDGAEKTVVELTEHHLPRIAPTNQANPSDDTEAIRAELEKIVARSQDTPVRTGAAIRAPKRIAGVDPETPALAARAHLKATVVVQIVIERDGSVSEVTFLRPAPQFEPEVRRALSTWKYEPVLLDGKPVRATLTLTIRFQ